MRALLPALLTRPRLWLLAAATAAVTAMVLLPLGSSIGAQEAANDPRVIDPTDVCAVPAPPVPFTDREQIAEVHLASVDCAFAQGITHGSGDGTSYEPRNAVRRDQMASFVVRTLQAAGGIDIPAPSDQGFTDISGNTHEDAINQLAALGITEGRTPTRYAPAETVRRDQMASFIMRAANVAFGTTFEAISGGPFTDVTATNVHASNINAGYEIFGLTVGQTPTTFAPDRSVRRDQMATFLIRLLDVTELTDGETAPTNLLPGSGLLDDLTDTAGAELLDDPDLVAPVTDLVAPVTDVVDPVADLLEAGARADQPADVVPMEAGAAGVASDDEPTSDPGPEGLGGLLNRLAP